MASRLQSMWEAATFGARNPVRRTVGLAACGVISGVGEALVVVMLVALVTGGDGSSVPLLGDVGGTWTVAALTLGVVLLLAAAHTGSAWIAARSARDVQRVVQGRLMSGYLSAPWAVQASVRTGELQELVTVRAQILANGVQQSAQALSAALNLVVVALVAISLSPLVTTGLALTAGVVIAVSLAMRRLQRRAVRAAADSQASLAVELTETAMLARELRVFGVLPPAGRRITERIEVAAHRLGRMRLAAGVAPPLTRDATVALLVVALAVVVSRGDVETAVLGSAVILVLRALTHAQALSSFTTQWTEREDSLRRIRDRLAAWRAPAAQGSLPCQAATTLTLRRVSYTYANGERPALREVDLELRRGELVGIIGRTGSGKSTLAGVLLGLLAPSSGEVVVDGVSLADLDPASWHSHTAWVGQEPKLLTGTVGDNIRFLRDEIETPAIARAAREAGLAGDLELDHDAGPAGASLSGGQRQRIAVARALAGRPSVVVLDEPTSALDVHTEATIRDTLERLRENRIVVVIAHRLSTVRTCDRLVVMEDGRVTVTGPPDRLAREDETWLHEALAR